MSLPDSDNEVTARRLSAVLTGLFSKISTALNLKADKVANATNGHFAALDANGNLTDSGKNTADFATAAQGANADSAIQGVKVNGTELTKDVNNAVDVPVPTSSNATPLMDGTAYAGTGTHWARGDHRHPTDDSREAVNNKVQSIDDSSTTEYPSSKAVADFVNSSIATNTATFLGNFKLVDIGLTYPATEVQIAAALNSHTWPTGFPTNNDYVYVEIQDPQSTIDDKVQRYKYRDVLVSWGYEYTLNNSSFTAEEKASIDSGITSQDVTNLRADHTTLGTHLTDTSNPHNVTAAQTGAEPAFNVLPISKGGTGGTTKRAAAYNIFSDILHVNDGIGDTSEWLQGLGSPSATLGPFCRNKILKVWEYIQNKISSVLGLTASSYGGKAATAGSADTAAAAASGSALESAINAKLGTSGDGSNVTSTFTKASGDTSTMASGSKLSAIFTAISSFFASLKALAFKDKAAYNDLSSGVQTSLGLADTAYQKPSGGIPDSDIASASTWNGKQNSLGISASGDTGKFLNERGAFVTPNYPSNAETATTATNYASGGGIDTALAGKLGTSGDGSNTTSTFTKASGDTSTMASGGKLSVIFTAISSFFASLKSVAFSGSYSDLSGTPTIPAAANNGVLTITQNGTSKGTFSANQSSNNTIALTDTSYSQISRGSGAGLAPGLPSGSGTAKYLREDGNWAEPQESLSIVSGWAFDDPIVQLSPESQYTLKVGSKRYAFETPAGSDTWKANSLSSEGYVKKGEGYYDCVWGTNSNGAPDWLALANLSVGYANNATSASNYSSGGGIDNALQGKAPKLHIDTQGIYGLAKEGYYGHVKLVKGNMSGRVYSDGEAAAVGHNHDGSYLKYPQSHTLQWGGTSVIGTYNGNNITLTMPANPFNPNGDYSSNALRANTAVIADSANYAVGASNFTSDGSIAGRFNMISDYASLGYTHWKLSSPVKSYIPNQNKKYIYGWDRGTDTNKRRTGIAFLYIQNDTNSTIYFDLKVMLIPASGTSITYTFTLGCLGNCGVPFTYCMDLVHYKYDFSIYKNASLSTGRVTCFTNGLVYTGNFESTDT